ncbi:hypothetical protein [Pseudonocardia sp. GCM10023141]|uniref:hypothetical protein n=1 Tax=Pseudonocardia sp. GCM10023141 TaxID=3252653 RepID=UPI003605FB9C
MDGDGIGAAAGFPVQVTGKFGPTDVPAPPVRVLALGFGPDAATVLGRGTLPVAVPKDASIAPALPTPHSLAGRSRPAPLSPMDPSTPPAPSPISPRIPAVRRSAYIALDVSTQPTSTRRRCPMATTRSARCRR